MLPLSLIKCSSLFFFFSSTHLSPLDFFLKDALYLLIDWQTLTRSSRQQWHIRHEVSLTSAPVLLRQSTKTHHLNRKAALAARKKERNPLRLSRLCFGLKIKNSGLWFPVGPSVSVSLGAAMTTPPLSELRNGFPLFAFLLMLQIANSFPLLLSLSLRWGRKKPSFVQADPI